LREGRIEKISKGKNIENIRILCIFIIIGGKKYWRDLKKKCNIVTVILVL